MAKITFDNGTDITTYEKERDRSKVFWNTDTSQTELMDNLSEEDLANIHHWWSKRQFVSRNKCTKMDPSSERSLSFFIDVQDWMLKYFDTSWLRWIDMYYQNTCQRHCTKFDKTIFVGFNFDFDIVNQYLKLTDRNNKIDYLIG